MLFHLGSMAGKCNVVGCRCDESDLLAPSCPHAVEIYQETPTKQHLPLIIYYFLQTSISVARTLFQVAAFIRTPTNTTFGQPLMIPARSSIDTSASVLASYD